MSGSTRATITQQERALAALAAVDAGAAQLQRIHRALAKSGRALEPFGAEHGLPLDLTQLALTQEQQGQELVQLAHQLEALGESLCANGRQLRQGRSRPASSNTRAG